MGHLGHDLRMTQMTHDPPGASLRQRIGLRQRSAPACGSAACDNLTQALAFDFRPRGVG